MHTVKGVKFMKGGGNLRCIYRTALDYLKRWTSIII